MASDDRSVAALTKLGYPMSDLNRPEEIIQEMHRLMQESRRLKQRHDEVIEEHERLRQEFEKLIRCESATQYWTLPAHSASRGLEEEMIQP